MDDGDWPVKCRVCGGGDLRLEGSKRGHFIEREFRFFECGQCGFLMVEPVTDFTIYDDAYYQGHGPDPLVNYRDEYENYAITPRRHEFRNLFALAEAHWNGRPFSPSPLRWLDFGCGAGGLLKYLRDHRVMRLAEGPREISASGHDVGSYARRLKEEDGFDILDFKEIENVPPGEFDVITCIEVVEHLPDPAAAVRLMARLLRPGGILLLTTGNIACPLARWQGIRFAYCMPEIHVSLFTPQSLSWLYREAGLKPVQVRYDGMLRFRMLKNLPRLPFGRFLAPLALLQPVCALMDRLYGLSAMPSAVKESSTST